MSSIQQQEKDIFFDKSVRVQQITTHPQLPFLEELLHTVAERQKSPVLEGKCSNTTGADLKDVNLKESEIKEQVQSFAEDITEKIHKLMDELDEFAKQKVETVKQPVNRIQAFLSSRFPGVLNFFNEFQANQSLKALNSHPFNITHDKLSLDKDVCCTINYSGGDRYAKCLKKIEDYLKQHFPGMCIECNKLPEFKKMIDIRLRKGVTGGDEFIHYIEGVKNQNLEDELTSDLPQIVQKISLELINMGFKFENEEKSKVEQPFKHTVQFNQKDFATKAVNKIEAFLGRFTPGILNYFNEIQGWQQLKIMQGRSFNIKHAKLDIGQDVTCLINYSGPDVYVNAAWKIDEFLHKHYPGMKIETMRLSGKENYIDLRLRKGALSGDDFLHYMESIEDNNLESVLAEQLPCIVNKLNLELINMGFRFDFETAKSKKEIEVPFHETKVTQEKH